MDKKHIKDGVTAVLTRQRSRQLKNGVTAVLMRCQKSRQLFGARMEKESDGDWLWTWSFPITESQASAEGYDKQNINSSFRLGEGANGCPWCGNRRVVKCNVCGRLGCTDGKKRYYTCPWCGDSGPITIVPKLAAKSGSF